MDAREVGFRRGMASVAWRRWQDFGGKTSASVGEDRVDVADARKHGKRSHYQGSRLRAGLLPVLWATLYIRDLKMPLEIHAFVQNAHDL
jgi:hypothetical protein